MAELEEEEENEGRLTPAMRSRKLQALDFVKRYYGRWGRGPSLSELGAALGVSKKRAHDLLHKLSDERQIEITAGKTRGIRLVDRNEELSEADVLLRISSFGWTIVRGDKLILPAHDLASAAIGAAIAQGLTEKGLPDLDYFADEAAVGAGAEAHGEEDQARPGARAAAPARGTTRRHQSRLGAPSS
jgi:hypothetical protein